MLNSCLRSFVLALHFLFYIYVIVQSYYLGNGIILVLLDVAKIDDSERLRPEELNQQNIEALVAENNLVSEPSNFIFLFHYLWFAYMHNILNFLKSQLNFTEA